MQQHRVKYLEPVHIGYTNQWKYALVTEEGSKFYPSDVAYHKSIDIMLQKLGEQDKELFLMMYKHQANLEGLIKRKTFYLSEEEFNDHCDKSLHYLETSDSDECRFVKKCLKTLRLHELNFDSWTNLVNLINSFSDNFEMDVQSVKLQENWRNRNGLEVERVLTMLELADMNIIRGVNEMRNLKEYQSWNEGRKNVIMSDKLCCNEILEACCAILEEEGRLEEKLENLQMWNNFAHQTGRRFVTLKIFENFLGKLEIDKNRFVLVPDIPMPEAQKCKCCDEKDEIEDLKRQLAEKSKLLEDQAKRSKRDGMRIKQLQNELEKSLEMIVQEKEMQKNLKEQASKIKQDYKKENQKLKEDLINKEKRIKQLEKELKESRESAKNERKKMNSEADSESRMANKNMKKMKAELEMAKLTANIHSKNISNLEKRNGQLQTQIEILEEKNSMSSGKDERIQELTRECEDLKLENTRILGDMEEVSMRHRELASKSDQMIIEIDRLQRLEVESEPSTSSLISQINDADIRECPICIDEIENCDKNASKCKDCRGEYHKTCLSEWLNVNPTCPNCRVHWPNPQEFPAL